MMRVVIIGGGTAGTEVARQLRFKDKSVEIDLVDKKGFDQLSPCSLPYYIEEIVEEEDLKVYNSYEEDGINYYRGFKLEEYKDGRALIADVSEKKELSYDKLVIAMGSEALIPDIKGLKDFYVLKDLEDARKLKGISGRTLIIGGGYIGVELASALKGEVFIAESKPYLFPRVLDRDMSKEVERYLREKNINVFTSCEVKSFNGKSTVINGEEVSFDNVIVSVGFKPNDVFTNGVVDEYLRVNEDVYCVGDLVKSKNEVTGEIENCMLANNAVKQAGIVAENILGGSKRYDGFVSNSVSKVGNLIVGSTGITSEKSKEVSGKVVVGKFKGISKYKSCNGKELTTKIICDDSGVIVGCQVIGFEDVAGRLNLASGYIKNKQKAQDLVDIDTCYNPCTADMHDPLVQAGKVVIKKMVR